MIKATVKYKRSIMPTGNSKRERIRTDFCFETRITRILSGVDGNNEARKNDKKQEDLRHGDGVCFCFEKNPVATGVF